MTYTQLGAAGGFTGGDTVLFRHTGGTPALFTSSYAGDLS